MTLNGLNIKINQLIDYEYEEMNKNFTRRICTSFYSIEFDLTINKQESFVLCELKSCKREQLIEKVLKAQYKLSLFRDESYQ